jgi:hypothetical protein
LQFVDAILPLPEKSWEIAAAFFTVVANIGLIFTSFLFSDFTVFLICVCANAGLNVLLISYLKIAFASQPKSWIKNLIAFGGFGVILMISLFLKYILSIMMSYYLTVLILFAFLFIFVFIVSKD